LAIDKNGQPLRPWMSNKLTPDTIIDPSQHCEYL